MRYLLIITVVIVTILGSILYTTHVREHHVQGVVTSKSMFPQVGVYTLGIDTSFNGRADVTANLTLFANDKRLKPGSCVEISYRTIGTLPFKIGISSQNIRVQSY